MGHDEIRLVTTEIEYHIILTGDRVEHSLQP